MTLFGESPWLGDMRGELFRAARIGISDLRRCGQFAPMAEPDDECDLCWAMADAALAHLLTDERASLVCASFPVSVNLTAATHAARDLRRLLDHADRGETWAGARIIALYNERATMLALKELMRPADRIAPSHEAIRTGDLLATPDLCQLRFAHGRALDAVRRADGAAAAGSMIHD